SKRQSSTCSATSLKTAKLVPTPSNVAPSGYADPGQTSTKSLPASARAASYPDPTTRCSVVLRLGQEAVRGAGGAEPGQVGGVGSEVGLLVVRDRGVGVVDVRARAPARLHRHAEATDVRRGAAGRAGVVRRGVLHGGQRPAVTERRVRGADVVHG